MAIDRKIGDRQLSADITLPNLVAYINTYVFRALREMRDALNRWLVRGQFTYAPNVPADVSAHADWELTPGTVTGPMVIDIQKATAESEGTFYYLQDGSGHTVSYTCGGRAVRMFGTQAIANERGADAFVLVTVAGVDECWIFSVAT